MKCIVNKCRTPTINAALSLNYKRTERRAVIDRGHGSENRDLKYSVRRETGLREIKTD